MTSPPSTQPRWSPLIAGLLAAAVLWLAARSAPAHGDAVRDLLWADDCAARGPCFARTSETTLSGFINGTSWQHFLALLRWAGLGIPGVQLVMALWHGAAVALVGATARRWLTGAGWLAAAALHTALLLLGDHVTWVWNPSLLALPCAAAVWAASEAVGSGHHPWWGVVGMAAGYATGAQPAAVMLVPAAGAAALVASARPSLALAMTTAGWFLPQWVLGPAALSAHVALLSTHAPMVAAAAGLTMAPLLLLRRRLTGTTARTHAGVIATLALGVAVLARAAVALRGHHGSFGYYYAAVWPVASLLAAAALMRLEPRRRRAAAMATALLVVSWVAVAHVLDLGRRPWDHLANEAVTRKVPWLTRYSFTALTTDLQGPECVDALRWLGVRAPRAGATALDGATPTGTTASTATARHGVLVLPPPWGHAPELLAEGATTLEVEGGAAALLEVPTLLAGDRAVACFIESGPPADPRCEAWAPPPEEAASPERFGRSRRGHPELPRPTGSDGIELVHVPTLPLDEPWLVALLEGTVRCPWSIVEPAGSTAGTVELAPGSTTGVTFARRAGEACGRQPPVPFLPCRMEWPTRRAALARPAAAWATRSPGPDWTPDERLRIAGAIALARVTEPAPAPPPHEVATVARSRALGGSAVFAGLLLVLSGLAVGAAARPGTAPPAR